MKLKVEPRISLIVNLDSTRRAKTLKRYGSLKYVSETMRYAVLYVSYQNRYSVEKKLSHFRFVNRVSESPLNRLSRQLTAKTVAAANLNEE